MIVMTEQIVAIKTRRNATANEVFRQVAQKIGLLPENWEFFALFEIVEHNFERKICTTEFPHSLYIANYSTAAATCLTLRKWLFHPKVEAELYSDQVLANRVGVGAMRKLTMSVCRLPSLSYFTRRWRMSTEASWSPGRGCTSSSRSRTAPACPTTSPASGTWRGTAEWCFLIAPQTPGRRDTWSPSSHLMRSGQSLSCADIRTLSTKHIDRLQACKDDGSLEDQVIEFSWETINTFELEEEGMSFMFQYRRAGKPDRWVRIYSQFYVFLFECFEKIQEEIGWSKQIEEQGKEVEKF